MGTLKEDIPATPINPTHYRHGKWEVIEFIEDNKFDFCMGNAVKYIARAGKKDPKKEREDLDKAIWYIERVKLQCETERKNPETHPQINETISAMIVNILFLIYILFNNNLCFLYFYFSCVTGEGVDRYTL